MAFASSLSTIYRSLVKAGFPLDEAPQNDPLAPQTLVAAFDAVLEREPSNRMALVSAIGNLGTLDFNAPPGLVRALEDPAYLVRGEILKALSNFAGGVDKAVPVLLHDIATNDDPVPPDYGSIAEEMHPSPAVIPTLIDALKSDDGLVSEAAAALLSRVQPAPQSAFPTVVALVKKKLAMAEPPEIAQSGADDEPPQPGGRARSLGSRPKPPPPGAITTNLAMALANAAPPEDSMPLLMELVKRRSHRTRVAGAAGLGELGPAAHSAIPALIANLKEAMAAKGNSAEDLGSRTAVALGQIAPGSPDAKTLSEVIAVLTEAVNVPIIPIRLPATKALGKFGTQAASAIPALKKLLENQEPLVRDAAEAALEKIEVRSRPTDSATR